ncbi:protein LOW PSII ACCUMULATION 1 [Chloropicon primus]|uniref:Uncharacterized protein n=2 Tax=Chloropicon primus TaxID=1764295 RepID=A0A5B8MET3_9CHLO|nr:hypothetical protein A3770_02p15840 [Chloropicon primus]UPQ98275.1 protein LOW PSII ACCUMULATION 1 [Chloropicon primus]|eukprot:QDZ19066.1 hypothetical protein A3770_02p15840 [Chloropicon primus]
MLEGRSVARAVAGGAGCTLCRRTSTVARWRASGRGGRSSSSMILLPLSNNRMIRWGGRTQQLEKGLSVVARAGGGKERPSISKEALLRSEVEAPFRFFRIFLWLALAASAGLGGLIATVRVAAGLAKGEIGLTFADFLNSEDVTGLAIDLAALSTMLFLYRRDAAARDKQIKRLQRETTLAQLKVEINLKKPRLVTLQQLQGFARTVIVAGTQEYVVESVRKAAEDKEMVKDRSICIIPLVLGDEQQVDHALLSELIPDPEVLLSPILIGQWRAWMADQMEEAGVDQGQNVYIGLRMDGRVRASGRGTPPWRKFVAELTPKEGIWSSDFMKGFDGRVN